MATGPRWRLVYTYKTRRQEPKYPSQPYHERGLPGAGFAGHHHESGRVLPQRVEALLQLLAATHKCRLLRLHVRFVLRGLVRNLVYKRFLKVYVRRMRIFNGRITFWIVCIIYIVICSYSFFFRS